MLNVTAPDQMKFLTVLNFGIFTTPTKLFGDRFGLGIILHGAFILIVGAFLLNSDYDYRFGGLWVSPLFDIRPSIVLVCVVLLSNFINVRHLKIDRVFILISFLFVVGVLGSAFSDSIIRTQWIMDFKFFAIVLSLYIFTRHLLKVLVGRDNYFLAAFFLILALVFSVDFIFLMRNVGVEFIPGITRVSLDSTKPLSVLLVIYFGLRVAHRKLLWLSCLGLVAAITLSFSYGSRMVYVDLFIVLLITAFMLRRNQFFIFFAALSLAMVAAYYSLYFINRENAELSFGRAESIVHGRELETFIVKTEYNFISRIDPIRYAQYENVFLNDVNLKNIFIGRGIGGFYTDSFTPFPIHIGSTFTKLEFDSGRFYRTHNFITHFYLKYGVVGLVVLFTVWMYPLFKARKLLSFDGEYTHAKLLILSVFIFLPISLIELSWSGKGLMVCGMLLAVGYHRIAPKYREIAT